MGHRIVTVKRDGRWTAIAEHLETGDRFGPEWSGFTEVDARDLAARWLAWQADHASALEALQQAEHAYHRLVAGRAFGGSSDEPTMIEQQKDALGRVEAARLRLDAIRVRQPLR